jgi:hypothetical protein
MKVIISIIFTLLLGSNASTEKVNVSFNQNCSAELTVEKDRRFQSADEDGAEFKLTLKNTSSSTASYDITTKMLSTPCSNTKSKSIVATKNSDMNVSYKSDNSSTTAQKNMNTMTLAPGASKEFIVNVTAVEGAKYNSWGCVEVKAISSNCNNASAELVLSVFVPDPSEE